MTQQMMDALEYCEQLNGPITGEIEVIYRK